MNLVQESQMTPAQCEAMDAVEHMTPKEIQDFAAMLVIKLENKIRIAQLTKKLGTV